jgi:RNA polymerase sigma factor (TIGR02999 family)
MPTETHRVTRLLAQISNGDERARDEFVTAVYQQLRKIARVRMAAEGPGHTLQATELVHEAYLKLAPNLGDRGFRNRFEFYAAAGEAMRRILTDHARRRQTAKRGSGQKALPLSNVAQLADTADPSAVLAFNEAFEHLEVESPDLATLVRLRFFAGLDVAETAKALDVSEPTVKRRWRLARAMLFEALEGKVQIQ